MCWPDADSTRGSSFDGLKRFYQKRLPRYLADIVYMNSYGVIFTVFLICVILLSPRRWAALSIVIGVLYLTEGQKIVIFGLNVFSIRLMTFAGFIRVVIREKLYVYKMNDIDKSFIIFLLVSTLIFSLRCIYDISERDLLMYNIGIFSDAIVSYFAFRGLVENTEKVGLLLKDIVIILIPFTALMTYESIKGYNIFSALGGVPEISYYRDGWFRSQASFRHPILAGSVGATMLPLFVYLITTGKNTIIGFVGIILSIIIVITSHSSGPLSALIIGIIAWMFWMFRYNMKNVRWSILGILLLFQIIMKAPVWYLIARLSDITGGDGWHRANLINQFIYSIKEWWLLGMPIQKTENWAATTMGWGGVDVTNGFVSIGISGGIVSLTLFIILLVKCYKNLGWKMQEARRVGMKQNELLFWGIGASLTSHVVSLFSVSYWDQFYVMWYMLLAVISVCAGSQVIHITSRNAVGLREAPNSILANP